MEPEGQALLDAALGLPEAERALIAETLLASLRHEDDRAPDEEFAEELDRRFEEARDDPSASIPWADLKAE